MTYSDRVFLGSCEKMTEIPDGVVDTCVTSPPYFRLRDYEHEGQIGCEESVAEYIDRLVAVFDGVRRVLKPEGTAWLNLGDSYAGSWGAQGRNGQMSGRSVISARQIAGAQHNKSLTGIVRGEGLKPKDLMGMPWRVAFALQAAGWWLRSDIIWHKPNPMPSSVNDRCTSSHEYVFMLAKSKRYYFGADAIREPLAQAPVERIAQPKSDSPNKQDGLGKQTYTGFNARYAERPQTKRAFELAEKAGLTEAHLAAIRACGISDTGKAQVTQTGYGKNDPEVQRLADEAKAALGGYYREFLLCNGANKRDVWTIATEAYGGEHYAVMPRELAKTCIMAGAPSGGLVLDPFMGSGTVAEVAIGCGRHYVGYELNPEYHKLIADRLGLFGAA